MPGVLPTNDAWLARQLGRVANVDPSGRFQSILASLAKNNGWTGVTLINSWVDGGGEGAPGYLKDALGFVWMRGYLTTGTAGTTAFVLPVGFRPGSSTYYPSVQGAGAAGSYIYVTTAGNVEPTYTSGGGGCRLTAVRFLAEN